MKATRPPRVPHIPPRDNLPSVCGTCGSPVRSISIDMALTTMAVAHHLCWKKGEAWQVEALHFINMVEEVGRKGENVNKMEYVDVVEIVSKFFHEGPDAEEHRQRVFGQAGKVDIFKVELQDIGRAMSNPRMQAAACILMAFARAYHAPHNPHFICRFIPATQKLGNLQALANWMKVTDWNRRYAEVVKDIEPEASVLRDGAWRLTADSKSVRTTAKSNRNKAMSVCAVETILRAAEEGIGSLKGRCVPCIRSVFNPRVRRRGKIKADDPADAMLQEWEDVRVASNVLEEQYGLSWTGRCICDEERPMTSLTAVDFCDEEEESKCEREEGEDGLEVLESKKAMERGLDNGEVNTGDEQSQELGDLVKVEKRNVWSVHCMSAFRPIMMPSVKTCQKKEVIVIDGEEE